MSVPIILASGSKIRATMLRNAGLAFTQEIARIDEDMIKNALLAEGAPPRDVADKLAELKAAKVGKRHPEAWVIGSDQVLECDGQLFSKPGSIKEARDQVSVLRDKTHRLLSAAVIHHQGQPVWRHVGTVRLTMRALSDGYIEDYVNQNWDSIRHAVGCYKLEEEGVRLFTQIQGDYFTVLGMPLLEILNYLSLREVIPT